MLTKPVSRTAIFPPKLHHPQHFGHEKVFYKMFAETSEHRFKAHQSGNIKGDFRIALQRERLILRFVLAPWTKFGFNVMIPRSNSDKVALQ